MKLTKAAIDKMRFEGATEKAKDLRLDDEVRGFGIRLWPSGRKTFVFTYRIDGRQRYITLGDYGALTPDQARKKALQTRAEVLRGIDPLAEKQKALSGETVADLAETYITRHARPRNKTWEKDQERLDRYVIPAFGTMKVTAVTRRDVAKLHDKIGRSGRRTTANRVIALLSSMFHQARVWGVLPENAANPASDIQRFTEVKRERFVTRDEMPELAKAIDREPNVYVKALIWLYLFTGMRKTELQTLRWDQVDLKGAEVHLQDTKGGRPLHLPLSSDAVAMFKAIPKLKGNPHVFCGRDDGCHIVNVSKAWLRIRERAKLEDVRLHDLRRTVGSWLAQSGASLALIGRVLNHSKVSTTQIYARFQQEPVAAALEAHAKELRETVGTHVLAAPPDPATVSSDVER